MSICHVCRFETNPDDREINHRSGKMICLGCYSVATRGRRARLANLPSQTRADIAFAIRGFEG